MNEREHELQDLVRMHKATGAAFRLGLLEHCFEHPFRWAIYRLKQRLLPRVQWGCPAWKEADEEFDRLEQERMSGAAADLAGQTEHRRSPEWRRDDE